MRRFLTVATLLAASAAIVACEDGPNQTFVPEPPGAGNVINGPGGGSILPDSGNFVGAATQGFDAAVGGQNASQLCTAAQQKTVWTDNFIAPIMVPGLAGGLDIAGGYVGSGGISGFDPSCLSYKVCGGATPAPTFSRNPSYTPTNGQPSALWSAPTYSLAKESWVGMTIETAETLLCQPANATAIFGGNYPQINWGEQGEFGVLYNVGNRVITNFLLLTGYAGTLNGYNTVSDTTYVVSMNNIYMTKAVGTGMPTDIVLNWTDGSLPALVNDMYEAFRETYAPQIQPEPNLDCLGTGHCEIQNNGIDDGILVFNPLNMAIFVATTVGTPAANSIPLIVQLAPLKILPFSFADVTLQLDTAGVGPTAVATGLGTPTTDGGVGGDTCTYKLGMQWGDPNTAGTFEHDCVYVNNGGAANQSNQTNQNTLLGGLAHDDEVYVFNTTGVDPQFAATSLPYNEVVADGQLPGFGDTAYEFTIDQGLLGKVVNDFTNNDGTKAQDWHGVGMITLEWANLVQKYMQANYGVTAELGDLACIANPVRPPLPEGGVYAPGTKICSGLEGIVTSAPPALAPASMAPNALGAAALSVDLGAPNCNASSEQNGQTDAGAPCGLNQISLGIKPGTWNALFCSDSGGLNASGVPVGYTNCIGGQANPANGYQGFYWDTMQQAVAISYGNKVASGVPGTAGVPVELADRRFFFQQWVFATVKYLESANNPTATLAQIDANVYDENGLFFDNYGGNGSGFEVAQYDDRLTVNSGNQAPTAFSVTVNLTTGLVNTFIFDRYNFRGDTAVFTAIKDNPSDKLGAETIYLANIAGQPVLQNYFGPGPAGYACATNDAAVTVAANCPCPGTSTYYVDGGLEAGPQPGMTDGGPFGVDGGVPLINCPVYLDDLGNYLFGPYADAFGALAPPTTDGGSPTLGTTIFNIPALGAATEDQPSGIVITPGPYEDIQSAIVQLPVVSPPATWLGSGGTLETPGYLLPYLSGATIGFPITVDGSRDKFYNTLNVDFSAGSVNGQTVNFNMDYEYVPAGSQNLVVRALESQNYFGLLFPCSEVNPATGNTDILSIRMYDNGATILDWITSHPASINDCGIQIKESIYGNYIDYISFGVNPGDAISGMRFGLNPGFGGSVITDGTVFDPNIVATLGQ
jgi:hypothetical protein